MDRLTRWRYFGVLAGLIAGAVGIGMLRQTYMPRPSVTLHRSLQKLPQLTLWAWERPELLDFPPNEDFGIAYVAYQVWLDGASVRSVPRRQPLRAGGKPVIPVVHIEGNAFDPPHLNAAQYEEIVTLAVAAARTSTTEVVQIDFEARPSQRDFYARLLWDVRRKLPPEKAISITALASWCAGDRWLAGLPVDEVVPMMFRMGRDNQKFVRMWEAEGHLSAPECRTSAGFSLDEWLPAISSRSGTRVYLFNPRPWTPEAHGEAVRRLRK